ncbi:hypothetical protein CUMW_276560 [Citrus unshiu]|uniref:Uncharacterized protein n=1 Tax=Citrus unshiu TaxID=55188 RepID=A0A2H5N1U4_CITUN|nr:hypothetical protein CUMW_276550 [Citrus unshiu]GAY34201.1 hypothetical protein CUMW_276560 [Citrus unshiu]
MSTLRRKCGLVLHNSVANDFRGFRQSLLTDSIAVLSFLGCLPNSTGKGFPIWKAPVIEFPPLRVKEYSTFKTQDSNNCLIRFLSIRR